MADTKLNVRLQLRSDTAANWAANSSVVLLKGEFAYETDEHRFKIGDGTSTYAALPYISDLSSITWDKLKPTDGIPASDLAQAVQDSLAKADSALQTHQTITITEGATDGTISVKVGDAEAVEVAVKGLGTAAYTNSDAYEVAGAVATHNTSADAHADIRGLVTGLRTDVDANAADISAAEADILNIKNVIPDGTTSSNQLTNKTYVDTAVTQIAARFIAPTADGGIFTSKEQLEGGESLYYAGTKLTKAELTNNDYAVVAITAENGTTTQYRYGYVKDTPETEGVWQEQYKIDATFTANQQAALDSGITSAGVAQIETNKNNIATVKATADNAMPKAGGDFTGAVTVQTPTTDTNPATKKYVDDAVEGVSTELTNNYATKTELTNGLATKQNTIEDVTGEVVANEYVTSVSQTNGKISVTKGTIVLPEVPVKSVSGSANDKSITVTTVDGAVTVTHNAYTTGDIKATADEPYMIQSINVEQGHVKSATAQSLSDALGRLSLVLDGGNAAGPTV